MNDKRIRLLSVETPVKTESADTKWISMVYALGNTRELPIDGIIVKRTITNIIEAENHYTIYIANNNVSQIWMDIPKSNKVRVEYIID
jgi:hypothetical protein